MASQTPWEDEVWSDGIYPRKRNYLIRHITHGSSSLLQRGSHLASIQTLSGSEEVHSLRPKLVLDCGWEAILSLAQEEWSGVQRAHSENEQCRGLGVLATWGYSTQSPPLLHQSVLWHVETGVQKAVPWISSKALEGSGHARTKGVNQGHQRVHSRQADRQLQLWGSIADEVAQTDRDRENDRKGAQLWHDDSEDRSGLDDHRRLTL